MTLFRLISASAIALSSVGTALAGDIDTKEVDRRAKQLMSRPGMVGLAVAVIDDGEIVMSKGYGRTVNGRGGKPVTEDTVFRWASVSKSVAAATSLSVANDGHYGLSSPVEAFTNIDLPETNRAVTLEDVLSHQVGITRNAFDGKIEEGKPANYFKSLLSEASVTCQPGTCHNYQNVAYDLSANMVEAALGVPYRAAVNERIFKPLGMNTASLSHEGLVQSQNWARPHNRSGRPYGAVKKTYFRVPAAAGVNSSVTDLAKWMIANMDATGAVVATDIQNEMQTPRVRTWRRQRQMRHKYPFLNNASYGLGWRTYDYKGGSRVIAHRGAVAGYRASVVFDPKTRDGVAMLWNSNSSRPNGLAYEVMDQSFGKTKTDWLGLNPSRKTPRVSTSAPKSLITMRKAPMPSPTVATSGPTLNEALLPSEIAEAKKLAALEAQMEAEIARIREAEAQADMELEKALLEDALAATGPFPDDTGLSGSGD